MPISETPEWRALAEHHERVKDTHLRTLFADDPDRGTTLALRAGDLYLDYSKNRLTRETIDLLVALAERAGLQERTEAMFRGEHINTTEDRAVLHVALRDPPTSGPPADGQDARPAGGRPATARMSAPTCTRCSAGWPTSPTGCAAASGPGTPASGSGRWSTSASAAPTSVRRWPTWRCATTPTGRRPSASCPTSTRPTSSRPPAISTRPRRCSSSRRRPSRPWRR